MTGGAIPNGNGREGARAPWPIFALIGLSACQPPADNRWPGDAAAAGRGRAAMERVKCGACHAIPGIDWPKGRSGPALNDFASRGTIAATLPNRPDVLAAFVRDAPAVKPGSPMPAMPISEAEARDIAVALYEDIP